MARKYDGSRKRGCGRPRTKAELAKLVLEMARDNPILGLHATSRCAVQRGHELGRGTIVRTLSDAGLEPAPERTKRPSWSSFLKAQWGAIAATDFFSVEVMTWWGVVRYHVFFVIYLKTRRCRECGCHARPASNLGQERAERAARSGGRFLEGHAELIHDRDPVFGKDFRRKLKLAGVTSVRCRAAART